MESGGKNNIYLELAMYYVFHMKCGIKFPYWDEIEIIIPVLSKNTKVWVM